MLFPLPIEESMTPTFKRSSNNEILSCKFVIDHSSPKVTRGISEEAHAVNKPASAEVTVLKHCEARNCCTTTGRLWLASR